MTSQTNLQNLLAKIQSKKRRGAVAHHDDSGATVQRSKPNNTKLRNKLRRECAQLAMNTDILAQFSSALRDSGFAGNIRFAELIFLGCMTRLFDEPVSIAIKGSSSSGKSHLVRSVLAFFPKKAWLELTSMSPHALAYSKEPLKHRMLVVNEASGISNEITSHMLRVLLSDHRIRHETVVSGRTKVFEREGPTGLIVTTTGLSLHPENETRVLSLSIEESAIQTRAIMRAQAGGVKTAATNYSAWHALQSLMALNVPAEVEVPFALALANLTQPIALRLLRDFRAILSLIRAHALLHRDTRKRNSNGQVVAQIEDYRAVWKRVRKIVEEGVEATVPKPVRDIVSAVQELQRSQSNISMSDLAARLCLDKSTVSRHVKNAASKGYLRNSEKQNGRAARLLMGDPLPDDLTILPSPKKLTDRVRSIEMGAHKTSRSKRPAKCRLKSGAPKDGGVDGK